MTELPRTLRGEVIAQLGFTGTRNGLFVLTCSQAVAKDLCAKMLMMEPEELTDESEIADGFGEIANMIGGNFKNAWVEEGKTMDLSIPAVTFGADVRLSTGEQDTHGHAFTVVIPAGEMRVDVRIHD